MDEHDPQITFHAANPTMETRHVTRTGRAVSELLEDSGNCRQIVNQELSLHLLSDSLFSERQKLRHALDWAHSFLSSDSEVHHQFCRAGSSILVDEVQIKSPTCEHSSAAKCHHPVSCAAGGNKVFGGGGRSMENASNNHLCAHKPPFADDPCIPFSFTPEYRETSENMKSMKPQDVPSKQTPSHDNSYRTNGLFISNQRQRTNLSDREANQTLASDGATCSIKEPASCWSNARHKTSTVSGTASNLKLSYKTAGAQSEGGISGHQMELSKVMVEEKAGTKTEVVRMGERNGEVNEEEECSSAFAMCAENNIRHSEPELAQEQIEKNSCDLKIPPTLTVYEQYQLCVDRLHHFRVRQSQHTEPGRFMESNAKEGKTSEASVEAPALPTSGFELNSSITNPEIKKRLDKVRSKRVTGTEIAKERSSDVIHKNQAKSKYGATLSEHGQTKHCGSLTAKDTPAAVCAESRPVCQRNTVASDTHVGLESNKCGLFPKRIGHKPDVKRCRSGVRGQKKNAGGRGASLRLCEKSCVSLASPTDKDMLQRPLSSRVIKHTPEDKVKPTSAYRDTHKCLPPTETHTPLHDVPGPTSPGARRCEQTDNKYSPAGVPACDRWLCLPDEVWLSILSLLPHSDLCRVVQVCSRLHALAADHTLWKNLKIENCNLTEQWLLCVGRRRPRSLCLYSCSGLSLPSFGLEMFLTLCRNFLEELKVTSCTGHGLHGDQMLPLIGQLCEHVTSVDVSWSGATDTGVKALSDCCTGLQLKSVVLNGCHVTDDPLTKLIMRHKESLCRLEVFGCQFLTPSCLQTVYEMCPGLQHLNIGQVPKVNAHSLTVMTSQLKCLISLNLTGLQAVTDATVDTLLQNCVKLQSLIFSSCPGVTDLTLHRISKYTPCIRSLDVSYCKAVTDAGVQSLVLGCRKLQQLDLSSTGTGNRGVTLLANYCSRHLHTVKLSFCHISSESILKLCRRCERLKVLHLYGSAHVPTEREIRRVNAAVKVYPLSSLTGKHPDRS